MIYIKSVLVGIMMLVLATIVYIIYAFIMMIRTYTPPPGGKISLDLRGLLGGPSIGSWRLRRSRLGFIGNIAEPRTLVHLGTRLLLHGQLSKSCVRFLSAAQDADGVSALVTIALLVVCLDMPKQSLIRMSE